MGEQSDSEQQEAPEEKKRTNRMRFVRVKGEGVIFLAHPCVPLRSPEPQADTPLIVPAAPDESTNEPNQP